MPVFAALLSGILGIVGSRRAERRQERAANQERQAAIDSERQSQSRQRDALRGAGGVGGTGDFQRPSQLGSGGNSSAFGTQLQSLTGR